MKRIFKFLILIILIIPCMFVFGACSQTQTNEVNSIVSIEKTSSEGLVDTYTITYSDGTSSTFTVTNGADGVDGEDGQNGTDGASAVSVVSIEKTSSEGLVDTYTITYSNNTTTTFTVTNGADGVDGINGTNGADASIETIYESACESGEYTGTLLEFLNSYLSTNIDSSVVASKAILSTVSVHCNFTRTVIENTVVGPRSPSEAYQTAGAGVIYQLDKTTGDAYIITNYHVVYDIDSITEDNISDDISILIYGYTTSISATYLGGSMTYDIAVLKITESEILKNSAVVAVDIANSDDIDVGETAIAIGNPEADGLSVTAGIVSVDSEYITMTAVDEVTQETFREIRIDTAVNGGNSGGGLFNSQGELIGIVNAKESDTEIENIGYAIPSNIAINVAQNIINNCEGTTETKVQKLTLGINLSGENSRAEYDSTTSKTRIYEDVTISEITSGSVASTFLNLEVGDVVVGIKINNGDELSINRVFTLVDEIINCRVGDAIVFTIERDGEPITVEYTVQELEMFEIE